MRRKYNEAVKILQSLEQYSGKKTDLSWLNRYKVYEVLKRRGYQFKRWESNGEKGKKWIEPTPTI